MLLRDYVLPAIACETLSGDQAEWGPIVLLAVRPASFATLARWERLLRGSFPDLPVQRAFLVDGWSPASLAALGAATPPSLAMLTVIVRGASIDMAGQDTMLVLTDRRLAIAGAPTDANVELAESVVAAG